MIREVKLEDAKTICDIYNYYIDNTVITFEETHVNTDRMKKRIERTIKTYPWLVYEKDRKIIGYAYAIEWKKRSAYKYTVESSIYLDSNFIGRGYGEELYIELLNRLSNYDFHSIIACITIPNPASTRLHEKLGFKKVGEFIEVGYKHQQWLDVGYWHLR